jgi:hypothetical protein
MKSGLLVVFFLWMSSLTFAQQNPLYSGGMLVYQPGYFSGTMKHGEINTMSNSVGGILRFYPVGNLTVGIYGGKMHTAYKTEGSEDSYFDFGYGGPFVGYSRLSNNFRFTASVFGGIGKIKNLHIISQTGTVLHSSELLKTRALVFSPIVSFDYAISKRIFITAQTLCLTSFFEQSQHFYNPTLQVGILFSR